jgi:hypothetical protein
MATTTTNGTTAPTPAPVAPGHEAASEGLKREFLVTRQGKSFVLYAGLLDLAHQHGLKAISTTLVQIPSAGNGETAICHACVDTARGTFSGLGDANPGNVSRMMLPHLIRMAETRAKARALRDAVNVGVAAVEELGELSEPGDEPAATTPRPPVLRIERGGGGGSEPAWREPSPPPPDEDDEPWPGATSVGAPPPRAATAAARSATAEAPLFLTPKQRDTILSMSRQAHEPVPADLDTFTRAQASELITALMGRRGGGR